MTVRPFTELPAHDRESLHSAIGNSGLLHAPHYTSFSVVFAYEQTGVRDRSVFIPGGATHYLEWDETLLRLTFEQQLTVKITSTTVSTELVARSPDEFKEYIGDNRGVVLDSLTSQQQDIVARAIDGTYTECKPYSEPFNALREQLSIPDHIAVLLVHYDGGWYFGHLY
ncbi:hypothetical protein [Halorubrum sp. AJ67]|uniref:hypothetical protein n=1 Tax=Halorubrum sp. AJ67 TaxID=1173487 RepID=UPI0018964731|nr:hypothetical protein [Halorubrum sp. AJ67]